MHMSDGNFGESQLQTYMYLAQGYGCQDLSKHLQHGHSSVMSTKCSVETPKIYGESLSPPSNFSATPGDIEAITNDQICYMDQRWQVVQNEYLIVSRLGKGCYGEVAEAIHMASGRNVAIKLITGVFSDIYELKKVIREIEILRNFSLMPNGQQFVTKLHDVITPTFNLE